MVIAVSTIVGALVGYVTNVVAVRLLFHPYRPVKIPVLGLKVQGLLPAKRDELAKRLGELAEEYMKTPKLQQELQRNMEKVIREALEQSLHRLLARNPLVYAAAAQYIPRIADGVSRQVASPLLESILPAATSRLDVAGIVAERIRDLDPREIEMLFRRIAGRELRFIEIAGLALGAMIGLIEGLVLTAIS
ncbi:hypothetical protein Pyrde_0748 [Pyrodictium delaneyi]|nr:hypothetical protein Pyrde_0748 [Pyrodictium delaneyi]